MEPQLTGGARVDSFPEGNNNVILISTNYLTNVGRLDKGKKKKKKRGRIKMHVYIYIVIKMFF